MSSPRVTLPSWLISLVLHMVLIVVLGLTLRLAEKVKTTGRTITLEPMPANERRIVHLALADDSQVTSFSLGDGESRKVAISLKRRSP